MNMNKNTPTVYVKASSNNTILSSKNLKKNFTLSCGCVGFKGAKRSSPQAAQALAETSAEYLQSQRTSDIILIFNGIGKGRRSVIKGLIKKNIKVVAIIEKTRTPFNGCRPKKKRRV
jgi:small subunit ribosomal protein S11